MPEQNKIALIIGVDAYYHKEFDGRPSLAQLPSCRNDAMDLSNLLGSEKFGYKIFRERAIIGSELDNQYGFLDVQRAIKNFFNDADLGQILLFYFSGHGIPREDGEVYLATPQVDPKDPLVEGFRLSDLTRLVNSSRARLIICIIDSCYSGAANPDLPSLIAMSPEEGDEKTVESAKSTSNKILDNLLRNEERYFLLSTQSYSRSYAPKDSNANPQRNSFFTKYVIQGLNGVKPNVDKEGRTIQETGSVDDNGYVTPESLYRYVRDRVRAEVSSQDPVLKSTLTGDMIHLASYPQLKKPRGEAEPISTPSEGPMMKALECIINEDYPNALSWLDKVLEVDPENAKAYFYRGNTFAKLDNYQEAMKSYQKALEIEPNPKYASAITRLLGMVMRYIERKEKGDEPEANDIHEKIQNDVDIATKAEKEFGDAEHLAKFGKYHEAIEHYERAIKIDPNYGNAWYKKGLALGILEKYNEAVECFARAIKIDPRIYNDPTFPNYYKINLEGSLDKKVRTVSDKEIGKVESMVGDQ